MTFLDKYTNEEIIAIIKESKTHYEVLIKMGRSANSGSNRMLLTQYIKDNDIDIAHFDTSGERKSAVDVFVKNATCGQSTLRRKYIAGNYSEYKCAICGLLPVWNGNPLTLILDHINGVGNDNELSNLRWICANCDRQLPTYGSRGAAVKIYCKRCGKELNRSTKSGMCAECYAAENYSGNPTHDNCPICGKKKKFQAKTCRDCMSEHRIQESIKKRNELGLTRDVLKALLRAGSVKSIAQQHAVDYYTVKRWCQQDNLPTSFVEIHGYSDEEWACI